ncbi:MAG: hypothetical protein WC565_02890 [Parcubacteria group bacterium]
MTPEPNLEEFHALTEVADLRRVNSDLQARLRRSRKEKDDLVEAVRQGVKDALLAYGPIKPVPPRTPDKRKGGEVALWHLTDWQGAKVTSSYNSEIMRDRVLAFCDKAQAITEIQRADHPVRDCAILFGGDMVEGLFQFPAQPFEIDASIFGQFASVGRLEADVVRRALAIYEKVTVISEWGNHGRVGSKRAAVPRSDNVDRMTYELAREILRGEERLTWEDSEEDIQRVEIGNYRALLVHGDEIGRNGFVSRATFCKKVADWKSGAYPWRFRDCYVGHYHRHDEDSLPDGVGAVYWSGSPESDNRYAQDTMAAAGGPTQRLHFVDPKQGRVTSQYKIWLA